ncbi:phage tail fiber protein [Enterobacter kobei]|uniref:phage tail fiber protein n=1 Tax=Enterobacter kobei TaxID=208224 RepID=UPI002A81FC64|nr:phage tail protein [Enterobacter kobei]
MLYNTGTIAINGNTATGTGTNWTAPASQVRAGQTIIVMSNPVQMFQISSVNSATSMTVTPAASPALSSQKYGILVSDIISVDGLAQAISQLINEYDENIGAWETFATTSANQSITVTINGAAVSIPGIGKLLQKGTNGTLAVNQGGTGATTKEDARTNLGLGTAATKDTGVASGQVLLSGSNGLCGLGNRIYASGNMATYASLRQLGCGFFRNDNEAGVTARYGAGFFSSVMGSHAIMTISAVNAVPVVSAATDDSLANNIAFANTLYGTANTTKASDGTLKAASPVARIVKSQDECQRADIDEPGFVWCGCGTANAEAEGITISRLDIGVYVLTGSAGLASEGWQLLPPMDPGGMGEMGVVEAEQTESGGLTVRLFKRKYMLNDEGEIVKTKGAPLDVPSNSWIDVRLDMPENSVWNQRQKAALEVTENESGS